MSSHLPDPAEEPHDLNVAVVRGIMATAAAGLGVIDPVAGVMLAGVVAGTEPWISSLTRAVGRRLRNLIGLTTAAREASGRSDAQLAEAVGETPAKEQLTAEAFEAAMRTAMDSKVRALGRCWATGLLAESDVEVDYERKLVAALGSLEPSDVDLLQIISRDWRRSDFLSETDHIAGVGWTLELLGRERPARVPLLRVVLAGLLSAGLVEVTTGSRSVLSTPTSTSYVITAFGRMALDSLGEAGGGSLGA